MEKMNIECPFCGNTNEVYLSTQKYSVEIKNQLIEYEGEILKCNSCGEEFEDGQLANNNLLAARDAYRRANHLLTSGEIAGIRKKYKLSQADFSLALGWGEVTVTRYESKQIQDSTYDTILRLVDRDPFMFLEILESNRNVFTEEKYKAIENNIRAAIDEDTLPQIMIDKFKNSYIVYNEPSEENGYTILDVNILNNIVGIILSKAKCMYKVALMKSLWYVDYLSYEKKGKSATGLVYEHQKMGALPIGNNELMYLPALSVEEEYFPSGHIGYSISVSEGFVPTKISKELEEIIDKVVKKFDNKKAKDIVDYMHKEKAYINTKEKEIIPFSKEYKLNSF